MLSQLYHWLLAALISINRDQRLDRKVVCGSVIGPRARNGGGASMLGRTTVRAGISRDGERLVKASALRR
jgi:hypothetical protein